MSWLTCFLLTPTFSARVAAISDLVMALAIGTISFRFAFASDARSLGREPAARRWVHRPARDDEPPTLPVRRHEGEAVPPASSARGSASPPACPEVIGN